MRVFLGGHLLLPTWRTSLCDGLFLFIGIIVFFQKGDQTGTVVVVKLVSPSEKVANSAYIYSFVEVAELLVHVVLAVTFKQLVDFGLEILDVYPAFVVDALFHKLLHLHRKR